MMTTCLISTKNLLLRFCHGVIWIIRNVSIGGYEHTLFFQKKTSYKTILGGLITLVTLGWALYFISEILKDIHRRTNMTHVFSTELTDVKKYDFNMKDIISQMQLYITCIGSDGLPIPTDCDALSTQCSMTLYDDTYNLIN